MKVLVSLGITLLLVELVRRLSGYSVPGLAIIALYLLIYWVVERRFRASLPAQFANEPDPDYSDWPTSGPIGRFGQTGLLAVWTLSGIVALLNPFQLTQILRQAWGNAFVAARLRRGGVPLAEPTEISYTLPFDGEWFLYNGGSTPKTSHSWDLLSQRYAMDFVIADPAKSRHQGAGTRAEDYHCYGRPILAAADGVVVASENRIAQAGWLGWGVADFLARSFVGNYVLIKHAPREYALYAHLVKGSVSVKPGQSVQRGDSIGLCGHTGHSTEPHLHFHVQDSADLFRGAGRPVRFIDLSVNGACVEEAVLTAGDRVKRVETPVGSGL